MDGRGLIDLCGICLMALVPSQAFSGDCEVVKFNSYESSYAAVSSWGGTAPIYRNFCAVVTIRSLYGVGRVATDATIVVTFQNDTEREGRLDPLDPVNQSADYPIRFGDTYTGRLCFPSDVPIAKVKCFFDAR